MYSITRKNKIVEDLELKYASGQTAHVLHVEIDTDVFAGRFKKCWEMLGAAQVALEKERDNTVKMERYGEAVMGLIALVFGDEQARLILDFYDGRYTEMLMDVAPFIVDVIKPQVQKASALRRSELERLAQRSK